MENERKLILDDTNILPFQVQPGGKEPPSDFWLECLDVGTVFLSREKSQLRQFVLGEFCVYNKLSREDGGAMLLLVNEQGRPPAPLWVDPRRFSNIMEKIAIIRTNAFQETEDDEDSGTVQPVGLPDDAGVEE